MINENDFFEWAFGNITDNATRAVFGEYIVHNAIQSDTQQRENWDGYDLKYRGYKIEVKTSGYVQTWHTHESKESRIIFDIATKYAWNSDEQTMTSEKVRFADLWVFCIHNEKNIALVNPLDETQWLFLVCSTKWLNEHFKDQKSVSFSSLMYTGLNCVTFIELHTEINNVIGAIR